MTKKQKAAAKSAAASRRYRAKLREKMAAVGLRGSTALVANAARVVKKREIIKDTGDADQVLFHMGVVHDMINKATEQAADRVAARFGGDKHAPDHAIDRLTDDGYNGAALNSAKTAPGEQGAFSAMTSRLDNLIERARSIRNRQGDSLMEAVGTREAVPTKGEVAQAGNAVQPPRGIIIAQMINHLDSIIAELDGQSRIICNTLA